MVIMGRRAVSPKKLDQVKELMVGVEKLLDSVNQALKLLKEYQAPQSSPAEASRKTNPGSAGDY